MSPSSLNAGEKLAHADTEAVPAWKQELNERLAATRSRRLRHKEEDVALPGLDHGQPKADSRAALLAAKVAQRYANAPSYSDVLAADDRARAEAAAAASIAREETRCAPQPSAGKWNAPLSAVEEGPSQPEPLEEEPVFAPVEPLAVSVIEYPRELVAPHKLRPRLAEGPLRETSASQTLSIGNTPADWTPIRLDTDPVNALDSADRVPPQIPLHTAALEDRIMAGIVDLALIVAAFSVFVLVFVSCTAHPPTGKPALLSAGLVLVGFCLLYHYLFFKYADGTPGMRYARIALCTFEDENPTRKAMCRRVLFLMLSAAPLGLGFAWAWFDPDRLSWHDRLSRIYQRAYS